MIKIIKNNIKKHKQKTKKNKKKKNNFSFFKFKRKKETKKWKKKKKKKIILLKIRQALLKYFWHQKVNFNFWKKYYFSFSNM